MSQVINAIYERGMLRPLEPLTLTEQSRVKLQILEATASAGATDENRQVEAVLLAAGLIQPLEPALNAPHVSPERRQALARLYATGGPLSEMVIAEREGR